MVVSKEMSQVLPVDLLSASSVSPHLFKVIFGVLGPLVLYQPHLPELGSGEAQLSETTPASALRSDPENPARMHINLHQRDFHPQKE